MKRFLSVLLVLALMLSPAQTAVAFAASGLPSLPDAHALFSTAVSKNIDGCSVAVFANSGVVANAGISAVITGAEAAAAQECGCMEYRWQRLENGEWADIDGANGESYTVQHKDIGYELRVIVTATGDFSGSDISEAVGPAVKTAYSGEEPEAPVAASPTDLTITVKTVPEQEYIIVQYGSGEAAASPTEDMWKSSYIDTHEYSDWHRFKGLRAGTRYAVWTRVPGTDNEAASSPVYSEFSTTGYYLPTSNAEWTSPFTDIYPSDWSYTSIRFCCANGIMSGMTETEFQPDTVVTRAMVVGVLWKLEVREEYPSSGFADVPDGNWYSQAVAWALQEGIITGYNEKLFLPNYPVTRQELAVILCRYAEKRRFDVGASDDLTEFSDADTIYGYARSSVSWAVGSGVITGTGDGLFQPKATITRGQLAVIIKRLMSDQ